MDTLSSMSRQCATEIDESGRPIQTGFCMEPAGHMKVIAHHLSSLMFFLSYTFYVYLYVYSSLIENEHRTATVTVS